jgi:alginate O-acetyltransferase complex protein AlgI
MVFASLEFITIFLPLFLILYSLVSSKFKNTVLLLSSWVFYGWWSPVFLILFMGLTLNGWLGGLFIDKTKTEKGRKYALFAFIFSNVGLLCWFKYANIVVLTTNQFREYVGKLPYEWESVLLPIGLSFIVLQSISYLIDVYRKTIPVDRSLISFGAYQSMFVHLIAGPIIRYDWVKKELINRPFDLPHLFAGSRRFMIGLSMKVLIADTIAPIADTVFKISTPSFVDSWIGCLCYSLQLFFDFSGYSAMAIGLGMMLGFRFPENFNNPYLATSIQDFWRRWHISLSSWIKDYLYIPLGGNRNGSIRTYVNLILTMGIAGLWHGGDSWNFLFWGLMHGTALCIDRAWSRASSMPKIPEFLSYLMTMIFVMLAWTIFRAHTFDGAMNMYMGQFGFNDFGISDTLSAKIRWIHVMTIFLALFCIALQKVKMPKKFGATGIVELVRVVWPIVGFLIAFALISSRGESPFLYFQF